ncbi:MAG: M56 family metallopeptidase, partial [Gemmatimonadota bacterium]
AVDVRLLRSADAEIAFTTGVLNPAIVVPASSDGWTEERRRAVLMHELAHVRRRDLLIHHISRWACAVYWVNPLAWTGARRLRAESERAADDLVLGVGTRPSDYADHLLQIISAARPGPMPGAVLPLARRREFEGRILAILEPHLRRAEPSRVQSGVLTVGVALLALPLAALAPVDAGAEDQAAGEIGSPPDALSRAAASGGLEFRGTFEPRSAADPEMDPQLDPDPNLQPERNTWSAGDEDVDVEVEVEVAVDEDAQADPDTDSGFATEPASSAGWADLFNEGGLGDRLLALIPGGRAGESTEGQVVPPTHLADREFRLIAIDALSDTNDDPRAIAALIRLLQSDTVPGVRAAAARGLAELEAVEAVGPLGNALAQDPDARVRATAAWALGEIEDPAAVDALVVGIRDEDAEVRRSSVWALAEIEAIESAPALASVLTDPDPDVRRQAARTLGELDLAQAPPELVAALGDQDPAVRAAAARALAEIEDPSTAAALGDALGDSDPRVRAAALEALVELESPPAIEALIRALGDENPDVRRAAAQALGDI